MSSFSLKLLKETLRPCSHLQPSTSSQSRESNHSQILRSPPKSNLSRQLQRLEGPFSTSDSPRLHLDETRLPEERSRCDNHVPVAKVTQEEYGEEEKLVENLNKPKSLHFPFDRTGPIEPLLLTLPGGKSSAQVPASINCRLLEHQREGVKFLYRLYSDNHGGILGDDMGLGKTIQTIAFLAAVLGEDRNTSRVSPESQARGKGPVLIICPTSVIHNWESEFSTWANFNVAIYHGSSRDLATDKVKALRAEVLITSFDAFRIDANRLSEIKWQIVIVDEAHRLKNNKSKLYAACLNIDTRKRIGLTGTVMQNKIMELFNLFDWAAPGCLGTREHFRQFYDEPLKHGQRSTAPEKFIRVAEKRKEHLVAVLCKYMLRRTKEETLGHLMMGKEDNVVFCTMSEAQKRVYRRILEMPDFQCLINKDLPCACGSPLKQVECCKRTVPDGLIWTYLHRENPEGCDSCPFCLVLPCIVKLQQACNHLELIKPNQKDEKEKREKDANFAIAAFGPDIDLVGGTAQSENFICLSNVNQCGKMRVLEKLLSSWTSLGDKILIFSYSKRMLDIIEKFVIRKAYSFSRLDGSTPFGIRQALVDDFNRSPSKQVFLISTRAGGLGLNIVSANRVVIFDPNWNPAQDLQAQDRSFRFGQKRHVVVFRLLAAGSFEELVYARQIYKQQLSNIAVSGKTENRYFEGVQDCKELKGELFGICNLFRDLSEMLFTSEIIELHERHTGGQKASSHHLTQADLFSSSALPLNEELGIAYAHRNEDVVNLSCGAAKKGALGLVASTEPNAIRNSLPGEEASKRIQYGLLAKFAGMEVIQFSKWVLSATPLERENLILSFKQTRRTKQVN